MVVLVVDVVFQFPKRDFIAGCGAGCEVGREPVDVPAVVVVVVKPENRDGPAVLLLVDPPNTEAVLLVLEIVEAAFALARDGGCPKPVAAVASPKMGLKFWTGGLLSEADVAEVVVVAVTAKMGLKPEAISGLVLLTDAELLAGAAVTAVELDVEEAEEAPTWLATPNRLAIGGVLLAAWET